jgi:hypothetical protein
MSFHKKKREQTFNSKLRRLNDEGLEEHWRCPAFCAVACSTVFFVASGVLLLGYYCYEATQNG